MDERSWVDKFQGYIVIFGFMATVITTIGVNFYAKPQSTDLKIKALIDEVDVLQDTIEKRTVIESSKYENLQLSNVNLALKLDTFIASTGVTIENHTDDIRELKELVRKNSEEIIKLQK